LHRAKWQFQIEIAVTGCAGDAAHTEITFDHVGTFGYNMILTCEDGQVSSVDSKGVGTPIANIGTRFEGPAVVPAGFGPFGGQIWGADENSGQVHAIASDGTITYDVFEWNGAEAVHVIPQADFIGLGGNVLVTSESGAGTVLVTTDALTIIPLSSVTSPGPHLRAPLGLTATFRRLLRQRQQLQPQLLLLLLRQLRLHQH
jgi:hypothetical protein